MSRPPMPRIRTSAVLASILLVAAVLVEFWKIQYAAQDKPLTQLELALVDTITFFAGGFGFLLIGYVLNDAQRERDRAPHGRSAFQRAVELYQALSRFVGTVDRQQETLESMASKTHDRVSIDIVRMAFDTVRTQVSEQVLAASHAMDDWKSEFPSVVSKIEDERRALKQAEEDQSAVRTSLDALLSDGGPAPEESRP